MPTDNPNSRNTCYKTHDTLNKLKILHFLHVSLEFLFLCKALYRYFQHNNKLLAMFFPNIWSFSKQVHKEKTENQVKNLFYFFFIKILFGFIHSTKLNKKQRKAPEKSINRKSASPKVFNPFLLNVVLEQHFFMARHKHLISDKTIITNIAGFCKA